MVKGGKNKEELLLQSFEILKNNLEDNKGKIQEIIEKIAKSNISLAVDMWRYVLTNGESIVKSNGYYFTDGMIYELGKKIGQEEVLVILDENDDILEYVFGKSNSISSTYIWYAMRYGYTTLAEKMYNLVKKNRYKEESLAQLIEEICDSFADEFDYIQDADDDDDYAEDENRASEVASILLNWVGTLKDKEAKARITVTLIDYV